MRSALAAAALSLGFASAATAAPHGMYLFPGSPGLAHAVKDPGATMLYYGGPVLSTVKVVAVIWGKNVNGAVVQGIPGFFTAVTNSTWFDQMAQYETNRKGVNGHKGTNQTIGRGTFDKEITINPHNTNTNLTDRDVQKEILYQVQHGVLPKPDANTLYMTYFPPNITITLGGLVSCQSFGAYHEGFKTKAYGGVFYGVEPDCGFTFDDQTVVSSHELAEATTDALPTPGNNPAYPQAWNTSDGYEIGDLCEGYDGQLTAGNTNYYVQQIFRNDINNCSSGNYTSP